MISAGHWDENAAGELVRLRDESTATVLRHLLQLAPRVGITRVADVTGLDRVGLPVYQAIRPNSRNISVSAGKGLTREQAQVSAIMEAIEGYHAETINLPVIRQSLASMRTRLRYDPQQLLQPGSDSEEYVGPKSDPLFPSIDDLSRLEDRSVVEWVPAIDLATDEESWVPAELCRLDFRVSERLCVPFFRATSNGLAAGSTEPEALLHALCETVERDSIVHRATAWLDPQCGIDPKSITNEAVLLTLERFRKAGLLVRIVNIMGETGLPCFEVLVGGAGQRTFRGAGCHPISSVALLRALTEAAQARVSHIAGSRDDLNRELYTLGAIGPEWITAPAYGDLADIPQLPVPNTTAAVREVVKRIHRTTGTAPVALNLARPDFGIPVFLVIAPGLRFRPPVRSAHLHGRPWSTPEYRSSDLHAHTRGLSTTGTGGNPLPRICLYAGPTLPADAVERYRGSVPATVAVMPPVEQGDLLRLLHDPPDIVAIIDGGFREVPSVTHKEILLLLSRGVRVLGAASMGALRAAELYPFGMEGVGEVFGAYRDGDLGSDDEVAVLHAPAEWGFRALTEPLVNIRHNLRRAHELGVISPSLAERALSVARGLHFTERTYENLLTALAAGGAIEDGEEEALRRFLREHTEDLKRQDAVKLIELIGERLRSGLAWPERNTSWDLSDTKYLHILRREYAGYASAAGHVPDGEALRFWRLLGDHEEVAALERRMRLRCIAVDEARHRGISVADSESLLARFRTAAQLASPAAERRWLRDRALDEVELLLVLEERDLERRVLESYRRENPHLPARCRRRLLIDSVASRLGAAPSQLARPPLMPPGLPWEGPLLRELKLRGRFRQALERAGEILTFHARADETLRDLVSNRQIEQWAARRWEIDRADLPRALPARGFASYAEFLDTARLAYTYLAGALLAAGFGAGFRSGARTCPSSPL